MTLFKNQRDRLWYVDVMSPFGCRHREAASWQVVDKLLDKLDTRDAVAPQKKALSGPPQYVPGTSSTRGPSGHTANLLPCGLLVSCWCGLSRRNMPAAVLQKSRGLVSAPTKTRPSANRFFSIASSARRLADGHSSRRLLKGGPTALVIVIHERKRSSRREE